ncbi:DUF5947 family protein [Kitasatospora sp. NPDC058965]|uniref:DUF5947 family protein n=1 Tax=Kitasatospora sp. NPDC058965 TaxID=3346682 RepID=UPI0036866223
MSAPVAGGLRRFLAPAPPRPERCELCGVELAGEHRHLVDVEQRVLACSCPPCALLLDREGAGAGRFRAVPQRYLTDSRAELGEALWTALGIPVGVAFLLRTGDPERLLAVYPGPAGPTESDPGPSGTQTLTAATGLAALLRPDTEALLLVRTDGDRPGGDRLCALVPVDAAYALVGRLRKHWRGFDGGPQARAQLAEFLGDLRARATAVAVERSAP